MPDVTLRTDRSAAASRALILGLFLFSGVSGLIYEVVWSRLFALVLGTTVYAVSTVLGVFMGGLALGSWLFGRVADRPRANGLRTYAWLEWGIGGFALVLPFLMDFSDWLYRAAWPGVANSFAGQMALRVMLAAGILIWPAILMGGKLPVLSRFLVRSAERSGREIGLLYAINTLGAVLGCFFAGFFLLEHLGTRQSLWAAGTLNFLVGAAAMVWARRATTRVEPDATELRAAPIQQYGPLQVRLALLLYACSGCAALALEVLWTRGLMYFTSVDTWAFTAMLSAFLCGLGLGSLFMSPLTPRIRNPLLVLGVVEILVGLSAAASIPLFERLHGALDALTGTLPATATLFGQIVSKLFASFFIMLVPTLLMGAAFPLVSAVYVGARRQVGRGVGTLYALNTIGAVVGSIAAGFLLIPTMGVQRSILLCASVFVALGMLLCAAGRRGILWRAVTIPAALLGVIALVFGNAWYEGSPIIHQSWYFKLEDQKHKILFYDESAAATLAVLEDPFGTKLLNINGVTTAINNHMDMQVHRMLSHLPLLLHPEPKTVLVVGFGMGSTPWGCCQHDVERVDVVELLRTEKLTAPYFEDVNHGVLAHPKLNFIEGDGRNYLLATRASYDVISFNAIHPRFSANLYTEDFYRLCRERLSERGVICAWLTQNSMKESEFRMLCRSFVEVFPNASLWYCNPEHFCLVGTIEPTQIDLAAWQTRMAVPAVRADLRDSQLEDPLVLASRFMFGGAALKDYVSGALLNTDDRPRIEFSRETKRDERAVIERLTELTESAAPSVDFGLGNDALSTALEVHRRAARWLMIGQTEHWYPTRGSPLSSEIAYRRALLLTPESQDVRHNLVFSDAIERGVQRELESEPRNPGALTRMGRIQMEQGRLDSAVDYFVRALKVHNRFVPAAEQLGLAQLFRGNPDEAVIWLAGLIRNAGSKDPRVIFALSVAFERQGRTLDAAIGRAQAIGLQPDVAEWFELLERTVLLTKRKNESPTTRPSGT